MLARTTLAAGALAATILFLLAPGAAAATLGATSEYGLPTSEAQPTGIAPGPDGNVWFTESRSAKIGRITPGGEVSEFVTPTAASEPLGIATGADGNLWFTEFATGKIGRVTPWGAISEFETPTPESGPSRITPGPDGNMWFVEERADKIGRITPGGAFAEFIVPTPGGRPAAIAAGSDGNLWFTEANANKIGRISPTGTFAEFPVPTASSGLEGIAAGPDGNLWFTEAEANQIGRITPAGEAKEFELHTAKAKPEWITAGADGNLWFTETGADSVGRITTGGTVAEFELATAQTSPEGIALAADGNLWFAEHGADRIGRIGAGAAEALASAPVVGGGGQQGSAQTCNVAWSTWDSLRPQPALFGFDGYRWLLDGSAVASGVSYTPTVANIGHQVACSVAATYPLPLLVTAVASSAPIVVTAPPKPVIGAARESAKKWRAGRALARIGRAHRPRRPPLGTTFSFSLNVQASVTFTFTQVRHGRRVPHTCVAPNRRNPRRKRCTRTVTVGSLSFAGHAGVNSVAFQGRVSTSSRLAPGAYTLRIAATNTAGVVSAPVTLRFTVVR